MFGEGGISAFRVKGGSGVSCAVGQRWSRACCFGIPVSSPSTRPQAVAKFLQSPLLDLALGSHVPSCYRTVLEGNGRQGLAASMSGRAWAHRVHVSTWYILGP